jgi:hypothetical protein
MVSTKGPSHPAPDGHSVHPAAVRAFTSGVWNLLFACIFLRHNYLHEWSSRLFAGGRLIP